MAETRAWCLIHVAAFANTAAFNILKVWGSILNVICDEIKRTYEHHENADGDTCDGPRSILEKMIFDGYLELLKSVRVAKVY